MAQRILTTTYLAKEPNANHDGTTQQICDRLVAFPTSNQMLVAAVQGVVTTRQAEDVAYKRFSGKDFASDDLKKEDALEDKYMSASLGVLNGMLYLPETEPMRRKAQLARQVFKDFGFSTSDGFEAEARKTVNIAQQFQAATEYTLAELGIEEWVNKAVAQAQKVLQLITVRVDNESAKVKGELADARKATDEAIRKVYDILNALNVLQPSAELTQLINVLFSIEDRAKQYYISGGKTNGGSSSSEGTDSGSSTGSTGSDTGSSGSDTGSGDSGSDTGSSGSDSGSDTGSSDSDSGDSGSDAGGSTGGDNGGGGGDTSGDEES